ncbi:uracil-DNA glycosylase family protein [Flavobacterium chungangense]|uniref:hypothetical protein n=1 Tax=Flavobacterium chungangense TaxID=554283 RepID=UPI0004DF8B39|nr:hypothetical protein [Flavobacterium chungangense]
MPCNHRFEDQLIPDWELEYLFIGTFNPSWDYNNAEQADYFYGRNRNFFWRILPFVFGGDDLKNSSIEEKTEYLLNKKIGITDLILCIKNADENSETDRNNLTKGFSDNILNTYQLDFNSEKIKTLINKNQKTLKGVFLTRSTLNNNISQIRDSWNIIENHCSVINIQTNKILTPARIFSEKKVDDWKGKIDNI